MALSMNRAANLRNAYQTATKKVLVVCSAGLLRSPTGANVLHYKYGYNTRSAGISKEWALIFADEALMEWADEIVLVNRDLWDDVRYYYGDDYDDKIVTLDLPDMYEWDDPKLRELIEQQYCDILKNKQGD